MNHDPLKIIIVDDEELTRKLLLSCLDWNALNMRIILEAVSPLEVLSYMEENIPDIIFTDIRMPYMDGLELSRLISSKYPQVKIVVLTAFKDFEYAKQSISIGVSSFLLKPINQSELYSTVIKLREQILTERAQWSELDSLKEILQNNVSMLRERFLIELLDNSTRSTYIQNQLSYYFVDKIPENIQIVLLDVSNSQFSNYSEEGRLLREMKTLEFVKDYLKDNSNIEILVDYNHHIVLLCYALNLEIVSLCEQLQQILFHISGYEISFGIGNSYSDIYKISLSYREAQEALKFSQNIPNLPISIYEDDINMAHTDWKTSQNQIEDIKFYIKAGLTSQISTLLPNLFVDDSGILLKIEQARILSITLISSALNVVNELGLPMDDLIDSQMHSLTSIFLETTSINLQRKTQDYLIKIATQITTLRANKNKSILWEILQYVQNNIHDSNLSLNSVADEFHLNSSYLSRIFKKELGFSFSKYLNRLRMESAISLINNTDLKVYQIAERVGIPDAYYFSNCFKKYTGLTVRDYKKGFYH